MPNLEDAIQLAVTAHRGQVDRAGQFYILHLLRVMLRVHSEVERTVAVLHDLLEDTTHTAEDLSVAGDSPEVIAAIERLTKRPGEEYESFISRVSTDAIARRVKLADLEDNMDVRRLTQVTEADARRFEKYRRAWVYLNSMSAG